MFDFFRIVILTFFFLIFSGDATLVLPAQNLYVETIKRIRKISMKIADALYITGPFNIQFLSKNNSIKVIECNLRASRSFPFVSKTFNVNFIDLATKIMVADLQHKKNMSNPQFSPRQSSIIPIKAYNFNLFDMDYVCVKSPMFSFTRLQGADPVLRVEMASTGEVACFGNNKYEAFLKSFVSSGCKLPIPDPHQSPTPHLLRCDYIYADVNCDNSTIAASMFLTTPRSYSPSCSKSPSINDDNKQVPEEKADEEDVNSLEKSALLCVNNDDSCDSSENVYGLESISKSNLLYLKGAKYRSNILVSIGAQTDKYSFVESAQLLKQMGFTLYTTANTYAFFETHKIYSVLVYKPSENGDGNGSGLLPNVIDLITGGNIHLVINIRSKGHRIRTGDEDDGKTDGYYIRRSAVDFHVPLISNINLAKLMVRALAKKYLKTFEFAFDDEFLHVKSWREYLQAGNRMQF